MFLDKCDLFHKTALSDSFKLNKIYKFKKDLFLRLLGSDKNVCQCHKQGHHLKGIIILWVSGQHEKPFQKQTMFDQSP